MSFSRAPSSSLNSAAFGRRLPGTLRVKSVDWLTIVWEMRGGGGAKVRGRGGEGRGGWGHDNKDQLYGRVLVLVLA